MTLNNKIQIPFKKFVQSAFKTSQEWLKVSQIADELINYLRSESVLMEIEKANIPGAHSSLIQSIILKKANELGFLNESAGLFIDYENKRLRPDYFLNLGTTGILIEVERGKTNQNNMDFLDIWKCHICKHAHYLFLFVPVELRQNKSGKVVGRPFDMVSRHLNTFFIPENYINVRGAVIVGY